MADYRKDQIPPTGTPPLGASTTNTTYNQPERRSGNGIYFILGAIVVVLVILWMAFSPTVTGPVDGTEPAASTETTPAPDAPVVDPAPTPAPDVTPAPTPAPEATTPTPTPAPEATTPTPAPEPATPAPAPATPAPAP